MGFAASVCAFFDRYLDFSGKASRSEYWWSMLFCLTLVGGMEYVFGPGMRYVVLPILIIPMYAVGARRLHDIGRSGWWQLIGLSGVGLVILGIMWLLPKSKSANQWDQYRD